MTVSLLGDRAEDSTEARLSPREEGQRNRWSLGVVTPDLRVGWVNRRLLCESIQGRTVQVKIISDNRGSINRTENVGHQGRHWEN